MWDSRWEYVERRTVVKADVANPSIFDLFPPKESERWSKDENDEPHSEACSRQLTVKSVVHRSKDYGFAHFDRPPYHNRAIVSAQ